MNAKVLNFFGLARRAGKFSGGHDAAFESIQKGKAKLCFLTADASERLKNEFRETVVFGDRNIPLYELDCSMLDVYMATGQKAAVFTVNDAGFASKLKELLSEEELH
ncbi:MAG: ribosomal L7Ae/L30e/S12e/Gadd45 family protein [Clostridia bacterium]|nr:ribosomal L7Ae/L30e/S12e/Gadd45 family protein [Clostridia bacterium]